MTDETAGAAAVSSGLLAYIANVAIGP
jgi:hypothetical protein